jgi:potassium-dependent mechanosensitive channel
MLNILPCRRLFMPLAAVLLASVASAQTKSDKPPVENISAEVIQARLKQVEDARDLDDALKAKIRDYYQQAARELDSAQTWLSAAAHFEQMAASAAADLAATKSQLDKLPSQPALAIPADITLPQIDQLVSKKQSELDEHRSRLAESEAEPKRRASRRADIPKLTSAAKDRIAHLDEQLQAPAAADEPAQLTGPRRALLLCQRRALECELQALEKEIAAYEATAELLPLRRDFSARSVTLAEQEIMAWQEAANRRRQQEAEKQLQAARLDAAGAHPAVKRLAHENADLAQSRKELVEHMADAKRQLETTKQQLTALKDTFQRTREKVDAGGLTNAVGLLLRKQRETLPDLRIYRREMTAGQTAISESRLTLLEMQDRRSALGDLEQQVRATLNSLDLNAGQPDSAELETAVRDSLQTEKTYLDDLIKEDNSYCDILWNLYIAQLQLTKATEAFATYIDERILWIASASPVSTSDFSHAGHVLWRLFGPDALHEIGCTLAHDAVENPAIYLLAIAVFGPPLYYRRRLRNKIQNIGSLAAAANCCSMMPTFESLFFTLIIASIWPGLIAYLSWRMTAAPEASEFCKAIGTGLAATATVNFVLELLRNVCRLNGLGEAHLGWPGHNLQLLRHHLKWLNLLVLPMAFIVATLHAREIQRWDDSLGRLCFIASMLLSALFLQRILRPVKGVFQQYLDSRRNSWMYRLRYVWYLGIVLLPLFLAALAMAGYYYTSQQLAARMVISVYVFLGLILLQSFLVRWLLINRRKLSITETRRRRAALQSPAAASNDLAAASLPAASAGAKRDLAAINIQTRRLVEHSLALAGLFAVWFIWADVLPALGFLNRVEVWKTTANVTESVVAPDGSATTRTVEKTESVTLAHLGLAILVLAATVIAAKNIPGLLEIALLQHLPVDTGVRYAVSAVSRYLITILGIVFSCNAMGLGWSKVQVLVAAVSVGLGFGLQEIFANFVSGLIILIERPIRVGDVITISDVTGSVSRIRMRATTIIDPDRKELIIPNKDVITGRVLNWTLSDKVNRVQIKVGIAYRSNTQQAAELLMSAAREHPQVLDDPAPVVTFEAFGNSTLDFVLRCFLPNLENRSRVIHELHMAIDRAFRENGIQIAFPQQDVHVRTVDVDWRQFAPVAVPSTSPWIPSVHAANSDPPKHEAA